MKADKELQFTLAISFSRMNEEDNGFHFSRFYRGLAKYFKIDKPGSNPNLLAIEFMKRNPFDSTIIDISTMSRDDYIIKQNFCFQVLKKLRHAVASSASTKILVPLLDEYTSKWRDMYMATNEKAFYVFYTSSIDMLIFSQKDRNKLK